MRGSEKKEILHGGSLSGHALQADDVSCLGSTVALDDIELYPFVLIKGLIAFTLNGGEVDENITALFLLDKAKTLLSVKPLYFTFHFDCASFRFSSCKSGNPSSAFVHTVEQEGARTFQFFLAL
jgi:hypothetical protein